MSAANGPHSCYSSVKWAPAYRWTARMVRELNAVWAALRIPARHAPGIGTNEWPPESVHHLRPFDAIVGTPGPGQSVLVRFVEPDTGEPRAVAKVMVSRTSVAAERVAAESEALEDPVLRGLVPRHLGEGIVAGHHYLVTEFVEGHPVPSGTRGLGIAFQALAFQKDGAEVVAIREHPWVQRVVGRLPLLKPDRLFGYFPVTRTHGDFAPWNVLVRPGGNVTLIDWEFSEPDGVAGVDIAHYLLATQQLLKRREPLVATRITGRMLQRVFGYAGEEARTLMALAAASVLLRELDFLGEHSGSFWKGIIEHSRR